MAPELRSALPLKSAVMVRRSASSAIHRQRQPVARGAPAIAMLPARLPLQQSR